MRHKEYTVNYVIKDYTGDDFTNTHFTDYKPDEYRMEVIANEIAERYYHRDPCDPNDFEATVGVKDTTGKEYWYDITAWLDINFSAREVKG